MPPFNPPIKLNKNSPIKMGTFYLTFKGVEEMKKLTVRLDEDDYNLLVEQCKVLECTQNQFFRELLRKNLATDIEEYNTTLKEIFRTLKIASNNLNQIAKKSHYSNDVEAIKKELNELWQSLKE